MLAELNSDYADWAPRAYDHQYRVTSLQDVHGGLGALQGYLGDDRRIEDSRESTRVALHLLEMAFSLVLGFAGVWAERTGKSTEDLADLHSRWDEARPSESEDG